MFRFLRSLAPACIPTSSGSFFPISSPTHVVGGVFDVFDGEVKS
jgi:hypothetical protein